MSSKRLFTHTLSRRRLLGSGIAVGAVAASGTFAVPIVLGAARQTPEASGKLVEWGFGIQESNPLARARVLAFQDAFPDVDLEIVESFDEQKLLTAAASDTMPDVLWLNRFETATWAARGVLMPLTDYIERDSYDTSDFYPFAIAEATYDGKLYGIPGGADVRGLYVNVDALEEAGGSIDDLDTSDWESLNDFGAKMVKKSGDQVQVWGFDNRSSVGNFWLWGYGNGGHFMNDDGTEATFNDEKVVEALQWAVDTYDKQGGSKLYDALATTFQGDQQFANGTVAMTVYEQWMLSAAIATVAPDLNFRLLPVRVHGSGPDGDITTYSGGNGWYIPKGAKNPDAAWEYIKFLHTDATWQIGAEAVKKLRQENNNPYFPSLTGKTSADQWQIDNLYESVGPAFDDAVKLLPELLEASHAREIGKSPVAGQLDDIMLANGVKPALAGSSSPQDALDDANQQAQDAIDMF
ncbi:MAG TPA: ABC transporter substrate-binding protein [Thermomicrobiales bacterium]|nr:ABC transporter substrate-binding protein [Thermomicrobiales bacterium]